MARFSDTFRSRGLTACTILAGSQAEWKDAELTGLFDQVILKLFQEPWAESVPGPLAPYNWIEDVAAEAVQAIGAKKLVVAIGNFAVEWTSGSSKPELLSYSEAMQRMSAAGADLRFSAKSSNSFSRYRDAQGSSARSGCWMPHPRTTSCSA